MKLTNLTGLLVLGASALSSTAFADTCDESADFDQSPECLSAAIDDNSTFERGGNNPGRPHPQPRPNNPGRPHPQPGPNPYPPSPFPNPGPSYPHPYPPNPYPPNPYPPNPYPPNPYPPNPYPPQPIPVVDYFRCESYNGSYQTCYVGQIQRARLHQQLSYEQCIEGRTWGYDVHYLWVLAGCRATFQVSHYR